MRKKLKIMKKRYAMASRRHVRTVKRLSRKPLFSVPFATFMVLLVVVIAGMMFASGGKPILKPNNSNVVLLNVDNHQETIPTHAKTVGSLIDRLKIKINPGDVIEPARDTEIAGDNFRINIYRAVPVTIVDGNQKTFTYSAAATPRSIALEAGITVYPEDNLTAQPTDNFLTESSIGMRVVIDRATPVNLNLYGTPTVIRTHAKTVGDLITEKHIKLAKDDTLQPNSQTPLTANSQVFIEHHGTQIVTVEQDIPMPVQTIEDDTLSFGTSAVRQQGADGKMLITYQVQLQNGVEVSRTQIQQVVTLQPVPQIIARGKAVQIPSDKQAVMRLAGISSGDYAYVDYIVSRESGWCPTKLQGQYGDCPAYPPSSIPSYLGYGLGQATPGSKMAAYGGDWQTSAITQLEWANAYAVHTYGSWANAYNHWAAYHNW
jgi:resuscitation-promoting factor RpfB